MRDFYELNNYFQLGKVGISRRAFETIAQRTANTVRADVAQVSLRSRKGKKASSVPFLLSRPAYVSFKTNRIDISVDVSIKKGNDVNAICEAIQSEIAKNVATMAETVPFKVRVNVVSII